MRLFEYAVIRNPNGNNEATVIVRPETVACNSEQEVLLHAAWSIPEKERSHPELLQIVVRSFEPVDIRTTAGSLAPTYRGQQWTPADDRAREAAFAGQETRI